jgi:ABC-type branched-subunit amino acid transport system ATPase component
MSKIRTFFKNKHQISLIFRIIKILSNTDKLKLSILGISQVLLSFLDLLGVALIGIIGSLAVTNNSSRKLGTRLEKILEFFQINHLSIQQQVAIIGVVAALVLISKTLFSIYFSRKTLFFLSIRSANVTRNLVAKLLNQSLLEVQNKSLQENIYMVTGGVGNIISGILGSLATLSADFALVIVLIIGLFYIDPLVSILTVFIFGGILVFLYFFLQKKASYLGKNQANLNIKSIELIQEVLNSYREAMVGGKRPYYVNQIGSNQLKLAINNAKLSFLPSISKYVLEITVVLGTLLISGLQFIKSDSTRAVTILSIYFAASARIVPALLRIQQSSIYIKATSSASLSTLEMIEGLSNKEVIMLNNSFSIAHFGLESNIILKDVSLNYPNNQKLALDKISIVINSGDSIAIVGKSGAGKTSLIDVLLGVVEPQQGIVKISGVSPKEAIINWPGGISYLPQNPQIINGTIRENVCSGYETSQISDELIWRALRIAQLEKLVLSLEDRLDTYIGDQGNKLSGGERQRLGIARAIITKPKLLVMDEATSSLDSQTEQEITKALAELKKDTTIILIAPRLSSTRSMDKIVYLEAGKVVTMGTFSEVRERVPDFDKQSQLMGL